MADTHAIHGFQDCPQSANIPLFERVNPEYVRPALYKPMVCQDGISVVNANTIPLWLGAGTRSFRRTVRDKHGRITKSCVKARV